MENNFTAEEEVQLIKMTLDLARSHGLEVEVMWSAMTNYKNAAIDANMNESLGAALAEWDI